MIHRFRGPSAAGISKATPQTLCQKCLKRDKSAVLTLDSISNHPARHYSYECKAPAQERPYTSRPSRTQQLANPKLIPTLTSDVSNDLFQKKGVADEELAKKEAERGRKRKAADDDQMNRSRKRSRSFSSTSVSTISTNLSRSPSPKRAAQGQTGQSQLLADLEVDRKRRRSPSTSMSYTSESSHGKRPSDRFRDRDGMERKSVRRRNPNPPKAHGRGRREYSRSRSITYTSESSFETSRRRSSHGEGRSKRRRHSSRSPDDRGRDRDIYSNRGGRRTRSPRESRDRSQVIKNRKSMTPGVPSRQIDDSRRQEHRHPINRRDSYSKDNDRYGGNTRDGRDNLRGARLPPNVPPPRKERSLSPFSKRLALTQAMNMGH